MADDRRYELVFDIVNSVKGGSGKSTMSLQLAAYWASQPDTDAYIIDLDLRGTSWRKSYDSFLKGIANGKQFLNELIFESPIGDSLFWSLKNIARENTEENPNTDIGVTLCICDPDAYDEIDNVKVDLLEDTVYELIKQILLKSDTVGKKQNVHIIFDMPPSYEIHAERVVKHLLMDKNSKLFKNHLVDGKCTYRINLLMLYAISVAHLEQDIAYVNNFLKQNPFSLALPSFISDNKFFIYFIGNDVSNVLNVHGPSQILSYKSSITRAVRTTLNNKVIPSEKLDISESGLTDSEEERAEGATIAKNVSTVEDPTFSRKSVTSEVTTENGIKLKIVADYTAAMVELKRKMLNKVYIIPHMNYEVRNLSEFQVPLENVEDSLLLKDDAYNAFEFLFN